jgi:hypothetical protein
MSPHPLLRPATAALPFLAFLSALGFQPPALAAPPTPLEAGFDAPPAVARPLTWWHWIAGNVTKAGITADLTAMKEAGIAGVQLFDAGIYLPDGPVRYGTDNWHDHVQFAIREAARLGLDVSLMNTPGWSASGGPWVTPERSMKKLVWTETNVAAVADAEVTAGRRRQSVNGKSQAPGAAGAAVAVAVRLPQPEAKENFYRDIAVLAVPADGARPVLDAANIVSAKSTSGVRLDAAIDGDPATAAAFPAQPSHVLTFALSAPATASRLALQLNGLEKPFKGRGALRASDDGTTFTVVKEFQFEAAPDAVETQITTAFKPVTARFFRVSLSTTKAPAQPAAFSIAELSLTHDAALPELPPNRIRMNASPVPRAAVPRAAARCATGAPPAGPSGTGAPPAGPSGTGDSPVQTAAAGSILSPGNLASAQSSTGAPLDLALDGDPSTAAPFKAAPSHVLNFTLNAPATAARLVLRFAMLPRPFKSRVALRVSDDGKTYRVVKEWVVSEADETTAVLDETFPPVTARHFRVSLAPASADKPAAFALAALSLFAPVGPDLASGREPPAAPAGEAPSATRGATQGRALQPAAAAPTAPAPTAAPATASLSPAVLSRDDIHDLTAFMQPDGSLSAPLPPGRWTILRFGFTSTGAKNHPAVPEGHGLEIDKLDADAVAYQFGQSVGRIIRDAGPLAGKTLTGLLFDSFEAGFQNWTDTFPAQFRALHGYDLVPLLPLVTGRVIESQAFADCVLHDFRAAVNHGFKENYIGAMRRHAHAHGLRVYCEPYGGPLIAAVNAPDIDILMGEFWLHSRFPSRLKFIASAANLLDRPVVAAEALTARPEEDGWGASLPALKRPGDHAFASGINRFILHTYAHQPGESAPGFALGRYGTHFNRLNTWWPHLRAWTDYAARSQFLLQQGWRHADLLLLQNEDIGHAFPATELKRLPAGCDFDFAYPANLPAMRVEHGVISLPHGPRWRVVVTPSFPWAAETATLRWLRDAVRSGVLLIGNPPECPAGLADLRQQPEFDALVTELWGGLPAGKPATPARETGAPAEETATPAGKPGALAGEIFEKQIGAGYVTRAPVGEALKARGIIRDLAWPGAETLAGDGESGLGFLHRRTAAGDDVYFVFNYTDTTFAAPVDFRVAGPRPELWDALSGKRAPAPFFELRGTVTRVPLSLEAGASVFVVFPAGAPLCRARPCVAPRMTDGENSRPDTRSGPTALLPGIIFLNARYYQPADDATAATAAAHSAFRNPHSAFEKAPWTLEFANKILGAPDSITLEKLVPWNEHDDDAIRHYSGTGIYRKTLKLPPDFAADARRLILDLGQVADIAEVRVNGRPVATLWTPPHRADLTDYLHPGDNALEIRVTNTWVNRLIGDERIPVAHGYQPQGTSQFTDGRLLELPAWISDPAGGAKNPRHTFSTWKHYDADSPLHPAGLLGPVKLEWFREITAD